MMIRLGYKRLGDYIEPLDERNTNLSVKLSQGISNNKYFITPRQVAENSANDKIVRTGQFAYNRATTRNGDKISIAYREGPDCTVSSAYQIFRIKDENKLNPYYLWMWFRRPEFDRYARFKSRGSAHEFFEWDEMCEVYLPIPNINEQRRIVAEYQSIEKRIAINNALIAKLEESSQTIYKKMFVDEIDLENLPKGWSYSGLEEITASTIGGDWGKEVDEGNYTQRVLCIRGADTPSLKHCRLGCIPTRYILSKNLATRELQPGDIVVEISGGSPTQSTGRSAQMSSIAVNYYNISLICSNFCRVVRPVHSFEDFYYAAFNNLFIHDVFFKHENSTNGLKNLDLDAVLTEEKVVIPSLDAAELFSKRFRPLMDWVYRIGQEQDKLNELLSLLLTRLA